MIETFQAGITLKVKHGKRYPGDLIPEAAEFANLGIYLGQQHIVPVFLEGDDYVRGIEDLRTRGEIDEEQYVQLLGRFDLLVEGESGPSDLEDLTKPQIRAYALEAGVAEDDMPPKSANKDELIAGVREALANLEQDETDDSTDEGSDGEE